MVELMNPMMAKIKVKMKKTEIKGLFLTNRRQFRFATVRSPRSSQTETPKISCPVWASDRHNDRVKNRGRHQYLPASKEQFLEVSRHFKSSWTDSMTARIDPAFSSQVWSFPSWSSFWSNTCCLSEITNFDSASNFSASLVESSVHWSRVAVTFSQSSTNSSWALWRFWKLTFLAENDRVQRSREVDNCLQASVSRAQPNCRELVQIARLESTSAFCLFRVTSSSVTNAELFFNSGTENYND